MKSNEQCNSISLKSSSSDNSGTFTDRLILYEFKPGFTVYSHLLYTHATLSANNSTSLTDYKLNIYTNYLTWRMMHKIIHLHVSYIRDGCYELLRCSKSLML